MKMIKGIGFIGSKISFISQLGNVGYCENLKQITVDFKDGSNIILTFKDLENMLDSYNKDKNGG
jgi:hypothetical protein